LTTLLQNKTHLNTLLTIQHSTTRYTKNEILIHCTQLYTTLKYSSQLRTTLQYLINLTNSLPNLYTTLQQSIKLYKTLQQLYTTLHIFTQLHTTSQLFKYVHVLIIHGFQQQPHIMLQQNGTQLYHNTNFAQLVFVC